MVFPLDRHLKLKWETDDVVRFDKHFRVWKTEFLWSPGGLKFSKCNVWKTRCIYNRRSARYDHQHTSNRLNFWKGTNTCFPITEMHLKTKLTIRMYKKILVVSLKKSRYKLFKRC